MSKRVCHALLALSAIAILFGLGQVIMYAIAHL